MKKLQIYIIKKFLGTFFLSISLIILIVIIFDISEKIDDFINNQAPLKAIIFSYYLNFVPYFVNLFSSLFTFISVVFFTSKLASHTEIVAILSNGISFRKFLYPYILAALVLASLSFYLANFLIPYANIKRLAFENQYIRESHYFKLRDIHRQIKPLGTFVYVQYYNDITYTGYRFTLEKVTEKGMTYKLTSDYIQYDTLKKNWRIMNYYIRKIDGIKESIKSGEELDTTLSMKPGDFNIKLINVDVMNYFQLRKFIDEEKIKGSDNIRFYEVEKYKRVASPFSTIVLTIIGVALSSRKLRGGIGIHLGLGILISFAYILFMQVATTFSTYGSLPAIVAVWIPNVLFAFLAFYLIKIAPK